MIRVTCRDGSQYLIGRRYKRFDEMQRLLEQRFPVEAGEFSRKERILQTLPGEPALSRPLARPYPPPGKLYLERSAVREVTDKRLPQLNSYLQVDSSSTSSDDGGSLSPPQHLFSLPDNIRHDSIVKAFARQTPQDRQAHSHSSSQPPAKPSRF